MKPLHLNAATRPFLNNRVVATVLGAAAGALVLATVYNLSVFLGYGGSYQQLSLEERQDREKLVALFNEERLLMGEVQTRDFRTVYAQGQLAGDLISRWSFSWTLLFNRLEQLMPVEAMMTAIRPTFGPGGIVVRVEGVAKNQIAFLTLQDALQRNPAFTRVEPISERKLNPSRPEISFVLNFDYRPAPEPSVVAAAGGTPAPAPPVSAPAQATPSPAVAAAAAPAAPARATAASPPAPVPAATESPAPASPGPTGTVAASTSPAPPAPPVPVIGSVGRDGRVRTPETLARVLVAPGGVHIPPEAAVIKGAAATQDRKGRKGSKTAPAPSGGATPPSKTSPGTAQSAVPGAPAASTAGPLVTGGVPNAAAASRPPGSAAPGVAMPKGVGVPRPWSGARGATTTAEPPRPAVPATRLDIPLVFESRPVREVYDAVARLHGVRFEMDGGVDLTRRVSVNLNGTRLPDAIARVSRVAGHRIVRSPEGVYRVALATGGESMADRPVQEEPLAQPETGP